MNNNSPSPATAMKGREPFASTGSRLGAGDRQPRRAKRRRDPVGADPPVRHPEQHQHTGANRDPGGERHDHLHRRGRPGDQPRNSGKPQRGPRGAPPRTAQPRRSGDRARHGGGQNRRASQRRPGKPRPLAGTGRQSARPLPARQQDDPGNHGARQYRDARQACQQPEPAVTQRHSHRGDGRDGNQHLHQPAQHPARHGGRRSSGHSSSAGTRIRGMSGDGNRHRPGEHKPSKDQADYITRMPVTRRRQQPAPRLAATGAASAWVSGGFVMTSSWSHSQDDMQRACWRGPQRPVSSPASRAARATENRRSARALASASFPGGRDTTASVLLAEGTVVPGRCRCTSCLATRSRTSFKGTTSTSAAASRQRRHTSAPAAIISGMPSTPRYWAASMAGTANRAAR